ncbi:MAG: hypothetical protein P8179_19095 [Candidatus Thiodiazotropha sp.]
MDKARREKDRQIANAKEIVGVEAADVVRAHALDYNDCISSDSRF